MKNLGVYIIKDNSSNILYKNDGTIIYGKCNGTVRILKDEKEINILKINKAYIVCLALYNDTLVIGSEDGTINIYDLNTNAKIKINAHSQQVNSVAIYNDIVISASNDGTCKMFKNGKLSGCLIDSIYPVTKVTMRENILMCESYDYSIHMWSL